MRFTLEDESKPKQIFHLAARATTPDKGKDQPGSSLTATSLPWRVVATLVKVYQSLTPEDDDRRTDRRRFPIC